MPVIRLDRIRRAFFLLISRSFSETRPSIRAALVRFKPLTDRISDVDGPSEQKQELIDCLRTGA